MAYNILQSRIEFKNGQLDLVAVLVEISKNDIRSIIATTQPRSGYMFIMPGTEISNALLQQVAAQGMEIVHSDEIFPDWKRKIL